MSEPTIVGLFIGTLGLAAILIAAWKLASWLAQRGSVIRPVSWMDHQMTKIEKVSVEKRDAAKTRIKD
jgi:uncharacterized membrane protein